LDSLNAFFNRCVDIALIVATRLAELPFAFIMLAVVLGVSVVFTLKRLRQRLSGRKEPLRARYLRALVVALGVGVALHMTQRTELLLRESRELQYYARSSAVTSLGPTLSERRGQLRLIPHEARAALEAVLGTTAYSATRLAEGVELARFHSLDGPPVTGWVAQVDLSAPALHIEITSKVTEKSLTSTFGQARQCVVAINGEAGISPARDAPLESYTGTLIANGQQLLPPKKGRPYLAFDDSLSATYYSEDSGGCPPPDDVLHAIWGRGDLLLNGAPVANSNPRWSRANPRTLMGIDVTGTRLTLAVIDGRQQGYSMGADLATAAQIMLVFGAENAMWCDQGGSSAMYLGCMQGIINRPSDGAERPTYSHFGVSLR